MSRVKVAVTASLMAVLLSACGIPPKPEAGTPNLNEKKGYYGVVDDPRASHVPCLKAAGLKVFEYYTKTQHLPAIQVGSLPNGPTLVFYPTDGYTQGLQIMGDAQGAEVEGQALIYPNRASTKVLLTVKACAAIGVSSTN